MTRRLILSSAAVLMLGACHWNGHHESRDVGPETTRNYEVGAFDEITVAGPYAVKVVTGGAPSVSATGGSALLDETEVKVEGDTLFIGPKKHSGVSFHWNNNKAVFTVNAAALKGAKIAGSGNIDVDRVNGDFDGVVAGSGDLNLDSVEGGAVELSVAGSGNVVAKGKANSVKVHIAGSGDVEAGALAARTADVSIAGSGGVRANASDSADVSIIGSGDVDIAGGAKCTVKKTGSGNVNCH